MPFFVALFLTPIALLVGFVTSIEGELFYTKLVFPYSVNFLVFFRWLQVPASSIYASILVGICLGLAIMQVPIYGLIVTFAKRRDLNTVILVGIHFFFVVLAFVAAYLTGI